ncbi:4145_t:CDS:10 [Paraglomus occultum]|uniref:4145_t:CDS:1 n=1 Tax=Paraglomus occultum TaxID=144539 RepID=A0A9N9A9Q1_9GLOM|nr:4145_t:CDS:10 [Paraglomus occultum]
MDHYTFIKRDAEYTSLDECANDTTYTDRFIPLHSSDLSVTFAFHQPPISSERLSTKRRRGSSLSPIQQINNNGDEFRRAVIVQAMLPRNEDYFSRRLFKFRAKERRINIIDTPERDAYSLTPFPWNVEKLLRRPLKKQRNISPMPYQMLAFCDQLGLKDDFYMNILDWSSDDVLSIGIDSSVYLWSKSTTQMTRLCELEASNKITSVNWIKKASIGANPGRWYRGWVGAALGCSYFSTDKEYEDASGTSCLAWNESVITSGSNDRFIVHSDKRSPADCFRILPGHCSEVCGLEWNLEGTHLSSGGNAGELFIWNRTNPTRIYSLTHHKAAVRALSWSPHTHNVLASGGGHLDRKICFWNTADGRLIGSHNAKAQVCNIEWSKSENELVSSHGWWKNSIVVWKYPDMEKIITLKGHTYRVLYLAMSPNGEDIVTGAGGDDNTLRFWKVFDTIKNVWKEKEDFIVTECHNAHGPAWVSRFLSTKTAKQCFRRWNDALSPGINMTPLTQIERDMLIELNCTDNSRWSRIALNFPGRTPKMIKDFWHQMKEEEESIRNQMSIRRLLN